MMYIINITIALWGPILAGSVAGWVRKQKSEKLLSTVELTDGSGMRSAIMKIIKRRKSDQHTIGWAMISFFVLVQFLFPTPLMAKAVGVFLTVGVGVNRMFRDLPFLVQKADATALRKALKEAVSNREKVRAEALMSAAMEVGKPGFELLGIEYLAKWQSPWAIEMLEQFESKSLNAEVKELCKTGYQQGKSLIVKGDLTHIDNLKSLISQSLFWKRVAMSFQGLDSNLWRGSEMRSEESELVEAYRLQGELVKLHPYNYCLQERSRGELDQLNDWKYVVGRWSLDYKKMRAGVYKVVGVIGPKVSEKFRQGELRLDLWNTIENSAITAEIDELELIAGADFNFDWAISASIEALRNASPEKDLRLVVKKDSNLNLSPNTLSLLAEITK